MPINAAPAATGMSKRSNPKKLSRVLTTSGTSISRALMGKMSKKNKRKVRSNEEQQQVVLEIQTRSQSSSKDI